MTIGGMGGRERCAGLPPTSITRVTTTAGVAAVGGGATAGFEKVDPGGGPGGMAGDAGGRAGGTPRVGPGFPELASGRAGGGAGGFASCVTELGRSAGGARPSFGGRLIVGPSSPALDSVVVDDESISVFVVFVAGAKSLERMLIAKPQNRRSAKSPIP